MFEFYTSIADESVQVPENWTHGQKSIRTEPGTAKKSWSVLEPGTGRSFLSFLKRSNIQIFCLLFVKQILVKTGEYSEHKRERQLQIISTFL